MQKWRTIYIEADEEEYEIKENEIRKKLEKQIKWKGYDNNETQQKTWNHLDLAQTPK